MIFKGISKGEKDIKPIDIKWLVIISLVVWLICILIPFVFSLAMNINFDATIDSINAREFQLSDGGVDLQLTDPQLTGGLSGALNESFKKTVSTEYKATVIPSGLDDHKGAFTSIGFLHGPAMVTGTPLVFDAVPESGNSDLATSASIRLTNAATPIVFFLVFILFILFIDWVMGSPNSALRFIVTISVVWLIWSLFTWALGGLTMRPVNDIFNQMLTSEQGSAQFTLGVGNIFNSAARIFIIGMLAWVGSFMIRRAKTQAAAARESE